MTPGISILLPVRNGGAYLGECLASLSSQTFEDFEVIAVDDGSTDGSEEILRAHVALDRRFQIVRQPASGLVRALERARGLARAPLLARMDADDVVFPERLERQLALLDAHPEVVVCGCEVEYFPPEEVGPGAERYQRWLNALHTHEAIERDLFVECPLAHPTFLMRAAAIERVGGYRDCGWPEDYDLLLRLWEAGGRFAKVPEVLLRWREGEDRLSRVDEAYSRSAFMRLKVVALGRTLLRGREVLVWGAGPTGKAFARALRGEGVPVAGFVDLDPRKVGQDIQGAEVVAPETLSRFEGAFCVAAVGSPGARAQIREALDAEGWTELEDYCAVA